MPELKVQLGVAEAEALAEWLEALANDLQYRVMTTRDKESAGAHARDWAKRVKPVPVGGWK